MHKLKRMAVSSHDEGPHTIKFFHRASSEAHQKCLSLEVTRCGLLGCGAPPEPACQLWFYQNAKDLERGVDFFIRCRADKDCWSLQNELLERERVPGIDCLWAVFSVNEVLGCISPPPYAIVILRLQPCNPISPAMFLEMEVTAPTGTEGWALQLPLEDKWVFLESGNDTKDLSLLI